MIDQRARDGNALLLAAGKLRGKMLDSVGEADAHEGSAGFGFIGGAVKILGEHHVFESGEIRDEMELLKDEADFFGAEAREAGFIQARDVGSVDDGYAGRRRVEAAENIDQRGLTGARRP